MIPPPPRRKPVPPPPRRKAVTGAVPAPLTQEEADAFLASCPALLASVRAWNEWDATQLALARLKNPKRKPKRKRAKQVSALAVVRPFCSPLPVWDTHTKTRAVERMLAEEERRRAEEMGLDG